MNKFSLYIKSILRSIYFWISISSIVLDLILIFFDMSLHDLKIRFLIFLIYIFFIVILTLITVYYTNQKITIKISVNTNLNIFYGDILNQKQNIVIPVNEFFDVIADDRIISSSTLHGKFVNSVFGSNVNELEVKISESLKNEKFVFDDVRKKNKYPLGTVAIVEKNGIRYFLVALTKFDDNNKAYCDIKDYFVVIQKLLQKLNNYAQGDSIYLPLIGSGLSNIKLSKQDLINGLIISLRGNSRFSAIGDINLVLSENLIGKINLADIQYYYK